MRTPKIALIALSIRDAEQWLITNNKNRLDYRICFQEKDIRGHIFTAVQATPAAQQMRDFSNLMTLAQMRVVTNAE